MVSVLGRTPLSFVMARPGLAVRQFLFQRLGIDSCKLEEPFIERTSVIVLSIFTSDGRASFVQHPWKDNITAKPYARAARRPFRQIRNIV